MSTDQKCQICGKTFKSVQTINRHLREIHSVEPEAKAHPKGKYPWICLEQPCELSFKNNPQLMKHLQMKHEKVFDVEEIWFQTMPDFKSWKERIEKENTVFYVSKTKRGATTSYYVCNRSKRTCSIGTKNRPAKGLRQMKRQGTCKLPYKCTSQLIVTQDDDKSFNVKWIKTHYGHELDVKHLPIPRSDRQKIAEKLKSGLPPSRILQMVAENVGNEQTRADLLMPNDLYNIKKSFKIEDSENKPKRSVQSVSSWVAQCRLESNSPLLFCKEKDADSEGFSREDFCIIYMNSVQQEKLRQFGRNFIAVDCALGRDFELITVMVADEKNEGFPVAFMFTNRKDLKIYHHFFNVIREKVGVICPKVFMGDVDYLFYNAFQLVMTAAAHVLYCHWFVDRAWQENLRCIINKENRLAIYNVLKELRDKIPANEFEQRLKGLSELLLNDEETKAFGEYFAVNYLHNYEKWAHCYRQQCGIDGSMRLESMDNVIKILKTVMKLDRGIRAVLNHLRFKSVAGAAEFRRSHKSTNNFKKHKLADQMNLLVIKDEDSCIVIDGKGRRQNFVKNMGVKPCCENFCSLCQICIHSFTCDCGDFLNKNSICVHVHNVRKLYVIPSISNCEFRFVNETNMDDITDIADISMDVNDAFDNNVMCRQDNREEVDIFGDIVNGVEFIAVESKSNDNCAQFEDDNSCNGIEIQLNSDVNDKAENRQGTVNDGTVVNCNYFVTGDIEASQMFVEEFNGIDVQSNIVEEIGNSQNTTNNRMELSCNYMMAGDVEVGRNRVKEFNGIDAKSNIGEIENRQSSVNNRMELNCNYMMAGDVEGGRNLAEEFNEIEIKSNIFGQIENSQSTNNIRSGVNCNYIMTGDVEGSQNLVEEFNGIDVKSRNQEIENSHNSVNNELGLNCSYMIVGNIEANRDLLEEKYNGMTVNPNFNASFKVEASNAIVDQNNYDIDNFIDETWEAIRSSPSVELKKDVVRTFTNLMNFSNNNPSAIKRIKVHLSALDRLCELSL